jgi:hypothetical protein
MESAKTQKATALDVLLKSGRNQVEAEVATVINVALTSWKYG